MYIYIYIVTYVTVHICSWYLKCVRDVGTVAVVAWL